MRRRRLTAKHAFTIWAVVVYAFLFLPILLIVLYAFDKATVESWPIHSLTFHWFSVAWHNSDARSALWLSVKVGLLATAIALTLGSTPGSRN